MSDTIRELRELLARLMDETVVRPTGTTQFVPFVYMTESDRDKLAVALPALLAIAEAAKVWRDEDEEYGRAMDSRDWQTCDQLELHARLQAVRDALARLEDGK